MKKFISMLTVIIMLFCSISSDTVYAAEEDSLLELGYLIDSKSYEDIDGSIVVEKTYFKPDNNEGISMCATSGNGWYTNTKTYTWNPGTTSEKVMTFYAKGHFVWGDGNVSVDTPSGGVSGYPSNVTISNRNVDSGTGRYGYVFNKYAYVTFSFKSKNVIGNENNHSVTIRISESGNCI